MSTEATPTACKGAIIAFALVFLPCVFSGMGVWGACWRSALVAFSIYFSVKLTYRIFINALIDDLAEFVRAEKTAKKPAKS